MWNISIPPSKSFIVWRIIHKKMSTDDNLARRGCYLPFMCNLCNKEAETADHLFLSCKFTSFLWNCLQSLIHFSINCTSTLSLFEVCKRGWSPQCKLTIISTIIYPLNAIWFCRNNFRFKGEKPNLKSTIAQIVANVSIVGNLTKVANGHAIMDFMVLKAFKVNTHHPNAPKITEVIWSPPILNWIKCNTDGAALGSPGQAACAGIFRNRNGESIGCFAVNLGITNAFYAELMGVIFAVECAVERR